MIISVIIPVFNQEKWIFRCIRSLINQHYDKNLYEIIVINDGSNDRTSFALSSFKEEIIVINNRNKTGLPSALNQGIKKANAKYIVRVDGDDYVNEYYLFLLSEFLEKNRYMDAVACDYLIVNDKEEVIQRKNCIKHPIGCGIMFQTSHLFDIGLYNEDFKLCEEEELRNRFQEKFTISRLELPLYRYRMHENNMTKDYKMLEKYKKKLIEKK